MYLYRDNKIEFTGNKKELIAYIVESYADEYLVEQYKKIFEKDWQKFIYVIECLGLQITSRKRRK